MVRILVEGKEKVFIERYLELRLKKQKDVDFEVVETGGWTSLHLLSPEIDGYTDSRDKICIIFDADTTVNNGGYAKRLAQIQKDISQIGTKLSKTLNIPIFLWPNNHDEGDFEYTLEEISNDSRKVVYECFNGYESCIKTGLDANRKKYILPIRKSRIFAYIEILPESKKIKRSKEWKGGDFLFDNTDYWNLDSAYINPLRDFLIAIFT